jgi:hypothetical protein
MRFSLLVSHAAVILAALLTLWAHGYHWSRIKLSI